MTGRIHWRCFHCDATFTKAQERWAREHFGAMPDDKPVCQIRTAGETALLTALRDAERELRSYRSEDGRVLRAMHAMTTDHATRVRQAEENGYNKGVRDARAEDSGSRSDAAVAIGEHAFRAGFYAARGDIADPDPHNAWSNYDPPEDIKALR